MVYGVEATGASLEVLKWPDKKTALKSGNSWLLIETEKELNESSVSTGTLAALWNYHNPDAQVKRFADREEGAKQVFAIFERVAITAKQMSKAEDKKSDAEATAGTEEGEPEVAKAATAKKGAKAPAKKKAAGTKGRGNAANLTIRKSKFTGLKLYPSADAKKENPRKAGSFGFKSLEIIRKSPGIVHEEFLKAGGRGKDLDWDVAKGNVTTKS